MSERTLDLAVGLTQRWVRLYTRGLPSGLRSARRAELESDLWEHRQWSTTEAQRPGRTALEIVWRLVAGVTADLSWRLEHRGTRRHTTRPLGGGTMIGLLKKHGMVALTVALGVWATTVVPVLVLLDDTADGGAYSLYGAGSIAFGLLILGGLVAMRRGLRGGRTALALGAIATGIVVWWFVIPAITAVAILVWLYVPRRVRRAPVQPA